MRGVYVTVLVTTSRMCRMLVRAAFCFLSAKRAFRAASQSKTEWIDLALREDRLVLALSGESTLEMAGLGGNLMLGNLAAAGGADIGAEVGSGVRDTAGADTGGVDLLLAVEFGDTASPLGKRSTLSVSGLLLVESGLRSPSGIDGEFSAMALDKKSV